MTPFGRHSDKSFTKLGEDAIRDALEDAGMDFSAIEVAFCGHVMQGSTAGQRVLRKVGKTGIPMMNVENACASGTTAFRMAWTQVATGLHDVALAVGFEKMARGPIQAPQAQTEQPKEEEKEKDKTPPLMPFLFSQVFNEHSRRYGTTEEQMAMVAVKNRAHAAMNPRSQHDDPITVEDVMESREIAAPLRLLMCCPTGAGAAAAIICSEDVARTLSSKPIRIVASAMQSERETDPSDSLSGITEINSRTAKLAYEMASITSDDIDAIELHDCFAIAEIIHYENLGLCERGEGGKFIEEGMSKIGGKVAVNPSGGLLSKGHPLGATGVAQVFEMVTQLRGDAGERQVPDAKIGLTHCQGFGGAVGVHIFSKD
jgi:acetyl-CoA acetyltransferase